MHPHSETLAQDSAAGAPSSQSILDTVLATLDDHKAEDTVSIDLQGKTSIADHMVISSGRSQRQVAALADYVITSLKDRGLKALSIQGLEQADWVLIDAGDVIVHLFRPEVRSFYALDKMWATDLDEASLVN